jgi:hypothetical protein
MVYVDSPFVAHGVESKNSYPKGILYSRCIDKNTPGQSFGLVLGNRKWQAYLHEKDKMPE